MFVEATAAQEKAALGSVESVSGDPFGLLPFSQALDQACDEQCCERED